MLYCLKAIVLEDLPVLLAQLVILPGATVAEHE